MREAYILKTAKYDPIKENLSKYECLDLVACREYSPPIIATPEEVALAVDKEAVKNADFIFHSPFLRTRQTAEAIKQVLSPNAVLVETPFLAEVHFSLKDLVSQEEYEEKGSNLVRQRFIERFISNDNLTMEQFSNETMESSRSIQKRINDFLAELLNDKYQNKKLIAISHSFFMKVLEIYLEEPTLFENPALLAKHFDWQKRTFEFCQGFSFELDVHHI